MRGWSTCIAFRVKWTTFQPQHRSKSNQMRHQWAGPNAFGSAKQKRASIRLPALNRWASWCRSDSEPSVWPSSRHSRKCRRLLTLWSRRCFHCRCRLQVRGIVKDGGNCCPLEILSLAVQCSCLVVLIFKVLRTQDTCCSWMPLVSSHVSNPDLSSFVIFWETETWKRDCCESIRNAARHHLQ